MILGIDGNEANVEERVGIGEYALELLRQFENFQFPISNFQFRIYLKEKPMKDLPKERIGLEYRVIGPKMLWTQFALPFDLFTHTPRPDVFFSPTHYAPRFSPVPTAISIMDLSYLHFPEMFRASDLYQLKSWTRYSVKKAKKVFTISNSSKSDIIDAYHIPEPKVVVTYPGLGEKNTKSRDQDMKTGLNTFGIKKNYILFVGTLQPRKNVTRLIEAFSFLKDSKEDLQLVIVGKKGWLYEEILSAPEAYGVKDSVLFLDFVADKELQMLYKNALCFVLPSLYEGFGFPVLEAMREGCPVVISNVSSLPEVGGEAAVYIDPEDVEDIASKIKKIIQDEKLRKSLIDKGYRQVKKFNWEDTAQKTLKALEEIVKSHER